MYLTVLFHFKTVNTRYYLCRYIYNENIISMNKMNVAVLIVIVCNRSNMIKFTGNPTSR